MCVHYTRLHIMREVIGYNNRTRLILLLLYGREDTVTITTLKRRVKCSHQVRTLYCIMLYASSRGIGEETILSAVMCTIKIGISTVFSGI